MFAKCCTCNVVFESKTKNTTYMTDLHESFHDFQLYSRKNDQQLHFFYYCFMKFYENGVLASVSNFFIDEKCDLIKYNRRFQVVKCAIHFSFALHQILQRQQLLFLFFLSTSMLSQLHRWKETLLQFGCKNFYFLLKEKLILFCIFIFFIYTKKKKLLNSY